MPKMKKETFPKPTRPAMPKCYGLPGARKTAGLLPWNWVEQRLSSSRIYWVCTVRPDGRPHAMPVWGVWVSGSFWFGTDRNTRKARNLASNPALAVHMEAGEDAVIMEGVAREAAPGELDAVDRAYDGKYGMKLTSSPGKLAAFKLRPRVVFAWREHDFPNCATRWLFE